MVCPKEILLEIHLGFNWKHSHVLPCVQYQQNRTYGDVNIILKLFRHKYSLKLNIPQLLAHNAHRCLNEMPFKTTSLFKLYLEVLKLCKHHPLHFSRTSAKGCEF